MRIDYLHLLTNDLAPQREFYAGVLGLAVLDTGADAIVLSAGVSKLTLAQAPPHWSGIYHFAFNIPEDRFEEAKEWLSERLALIRNSTGADEFNFEHWNAHALYFYDPAGNIVEFIARHDLAEYSAARLFSGQSILSISEIGLATDNVASTVQFLQRGMPIGIYDGEGSDAFTAVGDVHGLFIVVKKGRIWFPDTGKSAEILPVEVTVTFDRGERCLLSGPPYRIGKTPA